MRQYRVDGVDVAQETERKEATTKYVAWPSCAWLLLIFFPFPLRHKLHPLCKYSPKQHDCVQWSAVRVTPSGNPRDLNCSRTVAGITKWFWVTIEGYLSYLLPKFEDLILTSLGDIAI